VTVYEDFIMSVNRVKRTPASVSSLCLANRRIFRNAASSQAIAGKAEGYAKKKPLQALNRPPSAFQGLEKKY